MTYFDDLFSQISAGLDVQHYQQNNLNTFETIKPRAAIMISSLFT